MAKKTKLSDDILEGLNDLNDSWLGTAIKIADPTGISSYKDVYDAWTDGKFDYKDITETLGALPVVGKVGKVIKAGDKIIDITKATNKATKISKNANKLNKVIDLKIGSKYLENTVSKKTGKAVEKLMKPKSIRAAANINAGIDISNLFNKLVSNTSDVKNQLYNTFNGSNNKFAYGGSPMDVESPMQTLFDIIRNSEESAIESSNDPTVAGMKMLGKTLKSTGSSMVGQGLSQSKDMDGLGGFLKKNWSGMSQGLNMFAFGGQVPSEIEGEEAVELPNGQVFEAQGPSHEQGGIDMMLPGGSEVFSKRIKIDGVSIADRKKKREKKEFTLDELLKANKADSLIKNSLNRTKENNAKEEALDSNIQKVVGSVLNPSAEKFAYGGPTPTGNPIIDLIMQGVNGLQDNQYGGWGQKPAMSGNIDEVVITPTMKPVKIKQAGLNINTPSISTGNIISKTSSIIGADEEEGFDWSSLNIGDVGNTLGLAGDVYSAFAPMQNTLKNRAGDTPNINTYKDFGRDGLAALDESQQYIDMMKDEALSDLELSRNGTINRNNNSARGINTLRALNLATDSMFNNSKSDIYNNTAAQMMQLLGQKAQMENQQDQMVMKGEETRDLADRLDRDNFFSQIAEDIATKGKGIQTLGKDINEIKQNDVIMNLFKNISPNGITTDKNGNIVYTKDGLKSIKEQQEYLKTQKELNELIESKSNKISGIDNIGVSNTGKYTVNNKEVDFEFDDNTLNQLRDLQNFFKSKEGIKFIKGKKK